MNIGEKIPDDLELLTLERDVLPLQFIIRGADAILLLFLPYCYDYVDNSSKNMEKLICDLDACQNQLAERAIKVCVIVKELSSTLSHWKVDRSLSMDIYSDNDLNVSSKLVGTFDLSAYYLTQKNLYLGTPYPVSNAATMLISNSGKILYKYETQNVGKTNIILYHFLSIRSYPIHNNHDVTIEEVNITATELLGICTEKVKFMNLQ